MTQAAIEELLKQKIGLAAATIGSSTIARVIQQRMTACGITDLFAYWTLIQSSEPELTALIEAVIIPETWFFRDREPFLYLGRYVLTDWLPKHPQGIFRVLSLPCSTGEEPYSIAIALIEAGLTPQKFAITAIDISQQSLLKAQQAVYTRNSFRGEPLDFRDRYFTAVGDAYKLNDWVTTTVQFRHGNLLDPGSLPYQTYDAIFCRNVLIYFDQAGREQALQTLAERLTKTGLLFVGHAETGQFITTRFTPIREPFTFAYQLRSAQPTQPTVNSINWQRPPRPQTVPLSNPGIESPRSHPPSSSFRATPAPASVNLETIQQLASSGQVQDAIQACQAYLQRQPTNAAAYTLLGQLHLENGDLEKVEPCFQKALYLNPDDAQALTHLVRLKEKQGDVTKANLLRQRLQRLQKSISQ